MQEKGQILDAKQSSSPPTGPQPLTVSTKTTHTEPRLNFFVYRAPLQKHHDIPNAIGFLSWHLPAASYSQDKTARHRASRQSGADPVSADSAVYSLPHPQGHQGRNPLPRSCPSVLPSPVLGTRQHRGISPVLRMALSLLKPSRSPPCQFAPGRAGQDRAAPGRCLCL